LESQNSEWIAEASRNLAEILSTPQHRRRGTSFANTPRLRDGSMTPTVVGSTPGTTPLTADGTVEDGKARSLDTTLSLDAFQAKYTSEDNASFNTLLDKQNEKRRNAYAFLWNGNHIPGFRAKAFQKRLKEQEKEKERTGDIMLITAPDDRPAVPNTWKAEPRNGLMFTPDKSPPPPEKSEAEKKRELPPKSVVYANTRMPLLSSSTVERPPSPTLSAIADAIAGNPRPTESEIQFGYAETPRVNGYAFVDDAPPSPLSLAIPEIPKPSPFKIAATPKREQLHHRMVEKVAKNKRTANPQLKLAKTPVASPRMTPLGGGGKGRVIPIFESSPALTPAGHRLWGNLTGRKETRLRESILAKRTDTAAMGGTPRKSAVAAGGRGFRWVATPKAVGGGVLKK
jgi:protein DGCR14